MSAIKQLSLVTGWTEYPRDFEALWEAFPKRMGDNPKAPAYAAYKKALKLASAALIQSAVEEYARSQRHQLGTPYLPMMVTWLNQARWEAYDAAKPPVVEETYDPDLARWRSRIAGFYRSGFWSRDLWGPDPTKPNCQAPKSLITREAE